MSKTVASVFLQPLVALDFQFEEELSRNPYSVRNWWAYAHSKKDQLPILRFAVYERALSFVPRSYKLWHAYLQDRGNHLRNTAPTSKKFELLIATYERALTHMNKMPRIWLDYCQLLIDLHRCTATRRVFDRALQALPVTQHKDIWKLYIHWVKGLDIPETAIRVFHRYLMYDAAYREEYIDYLEQIEQYEEAARQLSVCLNDEDFVSPTGKTHHQMWMRLCDICSKHPDAVVNTIKVEAIIRSGISKFSDEVGRLWNSLADYYILLGQFDKARDIYEEAINSVSTVRDFTIIFDAYIKVEESLLTAKMRYLQEDEDDEEEGGNAEIQKTEEEKEELITEINMRLARIEYLMEKRPLLLNSVLLRQNPHNVHEWHKRVKLYKEDETRQIMTFSEAIKTIDPKQAVGKVGTLWMAWAQLYEKKGDLDQAEALFESAVQVNYKTVEELAAVWCEWAEMEIRAERFVAALRVMQRAVEEPVLSIKRRKAMVAAQGKGNSEDNFEGSVTSDRLYKNVKVWSFYLDLEESLGSVDSCKAAYDRVMDLKIITAQMALHYAAFLEDNHYYEESFRVYEKSVAMFEFPQVKKIWLTYLEKFVARYEGSKLERLRDLYEQAIGKVPKDDAAEFYIKYARVEEKYGMARHVVSIYNRATKAVPDKLKFNMYRLYVKKVEHHFGVIKSRDVYEQALKELSDDDCKNICKEYADMERKLGEIDRTRAILRYGAQFADPRRDAGYWQKWREFEETHGNEETFRDMLRVQRSVEVAFSQVNYMAAEMFAATQQAASQKATSQPASGMDLLAQQAESEAVEQAEVAGMKRKFVSSSNPGYQAEEDDSAEDRESKLARNSEEIEI